LNLHQNHDELKKHIPQMNTYRFSFNYPIIINSTAKVDDFQNFVFFIFATYVGLMLHVHMAGTIVRKT